MNPRRLKLTSILLGIALSGLVLLAWTQQWFAIVLATGASVTVGGDVAAPALTALALSGLALAAALALAGVVFRVVLGILQAALGALVVTSSVMAIANPVAASAQAISAATGVGGAASVMALVTSTGSTAWPVVALLAGILIVLLGIATVATARRWPASSRKYQAVRMEPADGESTIGDWDALSDGRDPTSR